MNQSFLQKKINLRIILFIFPVLLYINTVVNDYALDDSIVLTQNSFVKKGFKGIRKIFSTETFTGFFKKKKELVQGGRYRPLSVASFAIEHAIYGEKPGLSHLVNALLYGLFCLILFELLCRIVQDLDPSIKNIPVAFLATLIFAIHPLHTEVVANIKGRDELLAGVFFLLSFLSIVKSIKIPSLYSSMISGVFLFIALLSKENTIALIPLIILYFLLVPNTRKNRMAYLGVAFLCLGALGYILIRYKVIGGFSIEKSNELMNNPFLEAHHGEKLPTIVYTFLIYLKLLIFPHPLTYDYYPYHIELQNWSSPLVIASLIINLIIIVTGFYYVKRNRLISFAIFLYYILLLPVSNLFFDIGSFMNERFIFLSSIGFALMTGYLIQVKLVETNISAARSKVRIAIISLVIIIFTFITLNRNTVWKNNYTLFTHDVEISSGSAKANCTAGGVLYETSLKSNSAKQKQEMLIRSVNYLEKAISIYPNYVDALLLRGNAYFELNRDMNNVLSSYSKILTLAPEYDLAYQNMNKILSVNTNPRERIAGYNIILRHRPIDFEANYQMGVTYGKMLNRLDSATYYFLKAVTIQPENKLANRDLGVAYAMSGNYEKSLPYFEKVLKSDPNDPDNYINLGITLQHLGKTEEAKVMFNQAEHLKSN